MSVAATLSVVVKAQGIAQTNAALAAMDAKGAAAALAANKAATAAAGLGTAAGSTARQVRDKTQALQGMTGSTDRAAKSTGGLVGKVRAFGPIAAIAGAAAVGMGAEFGTSMQKIVALVGVSQKQVDAWKKDIIGLGVETGKSPRELAKALYFLTSAGLSNTNAFRALRISAKASAAGLGDMTKIADAVSSAMNAYGPRVMSAAKATDILVATAKAGKAEPEELAAAIGRVLPIASQMGVTFKDVGGAVAALSLKGLNAAESVTAVRQMLQAMIKPTRQAREALASVGLSADDVRKSLREKGLLATLVMLNRKFKGNTEALAQLFPQVEGFNSVLSLTKGNGRQAAGVFEAVSRSTGLTQKAFDESKTAGFRFRQALAAIEGAGTMVADVLGKLIGFFADNRTALTALMVVVAGAVAGWAGYRLALLALSGPSRAFVAVQAAVNAILMANPIVLVVTALAALAAALVIAYQRSKTFRDIVNGAFDAVKTVVGKAVDAIVAAWDWMRGAASTVAGAISSAWAGLRDATVRVWDTIKSFFLRWWPLLLAVFTGGLSLLAKLIIDNWGTIKTITATVWNAIRTVLTSIWGALRAVATTAFSAITTVVTGAWNAVRTVTSTIWAAIRTLLTTAWAALTTVATTAWAAVKTAILTPLRAARDLLRDTILPNVGQVLSRAWAAIKTVASTAWGAIKTVVLTPVRAARDLLRDTILPSVTGVLTTAWDAIKTVARAAWETVRGLIVAPIGRAISAVKDLLTGDNGLVGWLGARWDDIVSGVTSFSKAIKNGVEGAFRGAANLVVKFVNLILSVVDKIPGVDVGRVKPLAQGGTIAKGAAAVDQLARGGVVRRPMAIVGEEAPRHPEFVIPTNPAYRRRALGLFGRLGGQLGIPGYAQGGVLATAAGLLDSVGSAASGVGSAAAGIGNSLLDSASSLISNGPGKLLKMLPDVSILPGWLQGMGGWVLDRVTGWIKDKISSVISSVTNLVAPKGGGGPATAGTYAMANRVAGMFGLRVTSGYRDPMHNAAVGGVPNSLHTHGSVLNPGAIDEVGPVAQMYAALAWAQKHLPIIEGLVHDAGSGLHLHLGFFARGGVLGSFQDGTGFVPRTGPYLLHQGEAVVPADQNQRGPLVVQHIDRYYAGRDDDDDERMAARLAWLIDNA